MIIIAIQPEAKSNKFTEKNLEGIEEKWHIFCRSNFFCWYPNTFARSYIHKTSLRQILYIHYNKNKSRTSVLFVLLSFRLGELGFFHLDICLLLLFIHHMLDVWTNLFFYFYFQKYGAFAPPLLIFNHGCHGARCFTMDYRRWVYIYMGLCVCECLCNLKFICRQ